MANMDLQPLHGILSLHGRNIAKIWTCLVCNASHKDCQDKACSQCGRERIPSWLRGTNGCIIFPGAVVRCSREAVMYIPNPAPIEPANIAGSPTCFLEPSASRSPSPNKSPRSLSSPRSPVTSQAVTSAPSPNGGFVSNRQSRVTSTGLSDKQITLGTNPSRSRRGVAQAQSSPVHHGNSRGRANLVQVQGGPSFTSTRARTTLSSRSGGRSPLATHTGAARGRGKQIPHELSSRAMKAIFDAQPGETRTVMEGEEGAGGRRNLVKVTIDTTKANTLAVLEESRHRSEYDNFLDFGLCGRCDRTYRIVMGSRHVQSKTERLAKETELELLHKLVYEEEKRKRAFRVAHAYDAMAEQTCVLHKLPESIAETQRILELPVVMSCPFCLWKCDALFAPREPEAARPN